jgi:starch synthase
VASGFVFEPFDSGSLEQALSRALDAHADRELWSTLVRRAMRQDWSWDHSAREYLALYRNTVAQEAPGPQTLGR